MLSGLALVLFLVSQVLLLFIVMLGTSKSSVGLASGKDGENQSFAHLGFWFFWGLAVGV